MGDIVKLSDFKQPEDTSAQDQNTIEGLSRHLKEVMVDVLGSEEEDALLAAYMFLGVLLLEESGQPILCEISCDYENVETEVTRQHLLRIISNPDYKNDWPGTQDKKDLTAMKK